jgi:hypothetical protein
MPQSTTTYAEIEAQCHVEMGDSSEEIWDAATILVRINEATKEILGDLVNAKAVPLFDYLLDSIEPTVTAGSRSVDWDAAILAASKTYWRFWKATWNDRPVSPINNERFWEVVEDRINSSFDKPTMTWSSDGTLLLDPEPNSSTTDDFVFWWIKQPTAMVGDTTVSSLSEEAIPLYKYLVASWYYRQRRKYHDSAYQYGEYMKYLKKITMPYRSSKIYHIRSTPKD